MYVHSIGPSKENNSFLELTFFLGLLLFFQILQMELFTSIKQCLMTLILAILFLS